MLVDLISVLIKNSLPIFAEYAFDPRNNRSCVEDVFKQLLDVSLELSVIGLMDDFPLVRGGVKLGFYSEDRHDLLLVTLDMMLEVQKSCSYRALECFL
jgi:hypothetical protein